MNASSNEKGEPLVIEEEAADHGDFFVQVEDGHLAVPALGDFHRSAAWSGQF